jgi:ribonuclease E
VAAESAAGSEAAAESGEREPRGRRRGRGRDRAREEGEGVAAAESAPAEAPATEAWVPTAEPATAAAETVTAAMAAPEMPAAGLAPAAATVVTPPPAAEPIRIEPYRLPTDELRTLASSAGLEWVLSDAEKIRAVQEAMAAEPPPVRQPREPRRQVLVDDGPLVLVETRKDLSQLKLPFEASAG